MLFHCVVHLIKDDLTMEEEPAVTAPVAPVRADEKLARAYYCLGDKIDICIEAERRVNAEKELSFKAFCREVEDRYGVPLQPGQLRRWQKNLMTMKHIQDASRKKTKVACNLGRNSRLERIKGKLLPWIDAQIDQGKKLSIRTVSVKAKLWEPSLRRMKRYTVFAIVRRFLKANGVVLRVPTHQSSEDPKEKRDTATAFLESTRVLLQQPNRHPKFIINMDQTPYDPKDSDGRTLAKKGSKTVNSKKVKTSVGRITACLSVCADGSKLPPLIVYKGTPGGTIEREFKDFPKESKYAVQPNAWADERVTLQWVDEVLKPYVATAPPGVVPYLLLDKYKCHHQGTVSNAIENLGVEWDIIPGGCTELIQPIDVGVGRPWKHRIRHWMEDYMMDRDNSERIAPKDMRKLIAEWGCKSWGLTKEDVIWNSWRHGPFSYFPDEPTRPTEYESDEYDYDEETESEDSISSNVDNTTAV